MTAETKSVRKVVTASRAHAGTALLLLAVFFGCSASGRGPVSYSYFEPPDRSDQVYVQILRWQANERDAALPPPAAIAAVADVGSDPLDSSAPLTAEYNSFVSSQRRMLAERVREWVQSEAERRYRPDENGDEWPTFHELLQRGGDDCDGLELLSLHALRALGFLQVYRATIEQRGDGSQHMVTLWFEDPKDPWVIDPTGFATKTVVRMSELPAWEPRALFTEDQIFTVRRSASR